MSAWRDRAACAAADLARFGVDELYSRSLCNGCPVVVECCAEAVAVDSEDYAAGMSAQTRAAVGVAGMAEQVATLLPDAALRQAIRGAMTILLAERPAAGADVVPDDEAHGISARSPRKPSPSWKVAAAQMEWEARLAQPLWITADVYKPLGACTATDLWTAATGRRDQAYALDRIADILAQTGARTVADLAADDLAELLSEIHTGPDALPPGSEREPKSETRQGVLEVEPSEVA